MSWNPSQSPECPEAQDALEKLPLAARLGPPRVQRRLGNPFLPRQLPYGHVARRQFRFSTAVLRTSEYPKSSSCPAHLKSRGKEEGRTTTLTQGAGEAVIIAWLADYAVLRDQARACRS